MTKLFLAAGVAALAIAAPATAGPGDRGVDRQTKAERGKDSRADRRAKATERGDARSVERPARAERVERRAESREVRAERPARIAERRAARADRTDRSVRTENRQIERRAVRADRPARIENRQAVRSERNQLRTDRVNRIEERIADRSQRRLDRGVRVALSDKFDGRWTDSKGRGFINGCPPGLALKNNGCLPPGQAKKLVGQVIPATLAAAVLPTAFGSLYPDTRNYYYRYDDGYMYRVNRGSNLVDALLPLLGGSYLPGQYLPSNYMNSDVPSYYSAFYPNTSQQCTRYANGVVYYVDCGTGLIENFMPLYDNGYGVGQMLPAGFGYYNVPSQYRDTYYNNADTGYWYAPGAIYQYDRGTSLITSVAALLSPGMAIGQQMPLGYGAYNVPLNYRDTYYDTPDAWYRYNNGNIYQVDPVTQLVTALVASALT